MKLRIQLVGASDSPIFEYPGPAVVIGRDPKCDLPLFGIGSDNVSGRHAKVSLTRVGAFLVDLESTNGTFLNDRRLGEGMPLRAGDFFRLGQTGPTFRVLEIDLSPAAAAAAVSPPPKADAFRQTPAEPAGAARSRQRAVSPGPSPTRKLLHQMQGRMSAMWIFSGALLAVAAGLLIIVAILATRAPGNDAKDANDNTSLADNADSKKDSNDKPPVESSPAAAKEPKSDLAAKTDSLAKFKADHQDKEAGGRTDPAVQKNGPAKDKEPAKDDAPKDKPSKDKAEPPPSVKISGAEIYKKMLPSTVWIAEREGPLLKAGSGSLIDAERRLVLTAYHVVANAGPKLRIFFPTFDDRGKVKTDTREYPPAAGLRGKIVATDVRCDLALVLVEEAGGPRPALPLAPQSADPGDLVHSIGNFRAGNGTLWSYAEGSVRNVARQKVPLNNKLFLDCWVVETQSPVNPGDSGGPVVNDKGELIAVVSAVDDRTRVVSLFIDVREVHALLARYGGKEKSNR